MVFDLNAPTTPALPAPEENEYREPPFHVGDVYNVADELIEGHKRAMGLVFHEASTGILKDGATWGITVLDLATMYGWCPSVVLSGARMMEAFGLIELSIDSPNCTCDACVANLAYITLPFNFDPARRILWAQHDQEVREAQQEAHQVANRSRVQLGYVYLIKCGPRHKIGVTSDMNRRMDQLRGQSPYPLEIVHYAQGHNNSAMESRLHREYAEHRVHGEWFEFGPDQIAAVIEAMNDWQKEAH